MENAGEVTLKEAFRQETYKVENAKVQLNWNESSPQRNEVLDPRRAVIFIPAWNWDPQVKIIRDISRKIADHFGQKVYTLATKADQLGPYATLTEAKGMVQFLAEHNLSEVTIIGHSEGGIKATDLAVMLEKNSPQTVIDGLVLMDSMGLYKQAVIDLGKKFINDIQKVAPKEFKASGITPPEGGSMQFLHGIWQDMKFFGIKYPQKLKDQLTTMANPNPRLQEVKSPVLIITGDRDYVSDHRKYAPTEQSGEKANMEEMLRRGKARGEYVRKNIVRNAENVAMIVISKGAHHAGATDIRMDQVAYVASKIFERMRRPLNTA